MEWKQPKNSSKYLWTAHVTEKMHYYGLSEQKVLGVIRSPKRIETGIVENTVAVMLPVGNIKKGIQKPKWGRPVFMSSQGEEGSVENKDEESWNQEIWVMYQLKSQNVKRETQNVGSEKEISKFKNSKMQELQNKINSDKKITIISAWRYPGVSPKNNPIPEEILREIEEIAMK